MKNVTKIQQQKIQIYKIQIQMFNQSINDAGRWNAMMESFKWAVREKAILGIMESAVITLVGVEVTVSQRVFPVWMGCLEGHCTECL
jgi:hypothetical protein